MVTRTRTKAPTAAKDVKVPLSPDGSFAGKTALLLGGLGFIGRALARALLARGANVIIVARHGSLDVPVAQRTRLLILHADAYEPANYLAAVRSADFIFTLVGFRSDAPETIEQSWRQNCGIALRLLEAVRVEKSHAVVVHVGSRLQYGRTVSLPVAESAVCAPSAPYALHKHLAEQYHLLYHRLFGVKVVCLRLSNVYGPTDVDDARTAPTIVALLVRTLQAGKTFTIDGDGSQAKDFVHIDDVVEGALGCVREPRCIGEVLNIGSGEPMTLLGAATAIKRLVGSGNVVCDASRISSDPAFVADLAKIARLTGWRPRVRFAQGVKTLFGKE